jgi:predicted metal-dependent HD superfamily phosphohydrolase
MNWSRVVHTSFGRNAIRHIRDTSVELGLSYHNLAHIIEMYEFLHREGFPYDVDLDLAILFHDYVYDGKLDAEARSFAAYACAILSGNALETLLSEINTNFTSYAIDDSRVLRFIMATKDHELDNHPDFVLPIVAADLHALAIPEKAVKNYHLIKEEAMNLGLTEVEFNQKSHGFMLGLRTRVYWNRHRSDDDRLTTFWGNVMQGIDTTLKLSYDAPNVELLKDKSVA